MPSSAIHGRRHRLAREFRIAYLRARIAAALRASWERMERFGPQASTATVPIGPSQKVRLYNYRAMGRG